MQKIISQDSRNIEKRVLDDLFYILVLTWVTKKSKNYMYMVIDDSKVPYMSSYTLYIS